MTTIRVRKSSGPWISLFHSWKILISWRFAPIRTEYLEELSKAERKKIRALIKARKPGLDEWNSLMDTFERILSDLEDE